MANVACFCEFLRPRFTCVPKFPHKKRIDLDMFRNLFRDFSDVSFGLFLHQGKKRRAMFQFGYSKKLLAGLHRFKPHTSLNQVCIVHEFWASIFRVLFCYVLTP